MGFPIRKSADQSLFAAPHGLSQRTTSFIASQRQGIHRIPLRHLIALIIDAHRSAAALFPFENEICIDRKTSLLQTHPRALRSRDAHLLVARLQLERSRSIEDDRMHFLFTMTDNTHLDLASNAELCFRTSCDARSFGDPPSGGARRDRTDDLMLAKHALSQLSYGPEQSRLERVVGLGRLELPTSRLSSARSNQLSYKPKLSHASQPRRAGSSWRRKRNEDGGCPARSA